MIENNWNLESALGLQLREIDKLQDRCVRILNRGQSV
jgi:hypothetical protein